MARVVGKGAIVFGLVHIPVDLYPGSRDNDLNFDWIDKRDMAPVGYQRINKSTGKPVDPAQIAKGYEYAARGGSGFVVQRHDARTHYDFERRARLGKLLGTKPRGPLFFSQALEGEGHALLDEACELGSKARSPSVQTRLT